MQGPVVIFLGVRWRVGMGDPAEGSRATLEQVGRLERDLTFW